jgi:hypothetical protein
LKTQEVPGGADIADEDVDDRSNNVQNPLLEGGRRRSIVLLEDGCLLLVDMLEQTDGASPKALRYLGAGELAKRGLQKNLIVQLENKRAYTDIAHVTLGDGVVSSNTRSRLSIS